MQERLEEETKNWRNKGRDVTHFHLGQKIKISPQPGHGDKKPQPTPGAARLVDTLDFNKTDAPKF